MLFVIHRMKQKMILIPRNCKLRKNEKKNWLIFLVTIYANWCKLIDSVYKSQEPPLKKTLLLPMTTPLACST